MSEYNRENPRNIQYPLIHDNCQIRNPPRMWLMARNFSVAKYRSAICPATNGAMIAPTAPTANMSPISAPSNPWCPLRNGQSNGSHAPQIAYCRNIMNERRA
jgi:hypothetical protein